MAIDQQRAAKMRTGCAHQFCERRVIGRVGASNSLRDFTQRHLAGIKRASIRGKLRYDAEPRPHAMGPGIASGGHGHAIAVDQHFRVDFVFTAIEIDIGAGIERLQERSPNVRCRRKQMIDKRVLKLPQAWQFAIGNAKEFRRIKPPGMG